MLIHGLVSRGLFVIAGGIGEIVHTRSVLLVSGFVDFLRVLGILIIVGFILNVGFPVRGVILGELEVLIGVVSG